MKNGEQNWQLVADQLPGRIAKQCRERWLYQLNPAITKKKWTMEEDIILANLYSKFGSCWTEISKHINGRTDNNIKNRFHQSIKKRMQGDGDLAKYLQNSTFGVEMSKRCSKGEENDIKDIFLVEKVESRSVSPLKVNLPHKENE